MSSAGPSPPFDIPDPVVHHVPRRVKRDPVPARLTLNLTSMIDVIFQLLIYFVVTASFAPGEGIITANLPQGSGTADPLKMPDDPIRVVVSPAGLSGYRLEIEGQGAPRDFRELYEQLVLLQYDESRNQLSGSHKPSDPVLIQPGGEVRWQHVVNAFNAAVRARYTNIQFAQAD